MDEAGKTAVGLDPELVFKSSGRQVRRWVWPFSFYQLGLALCDMAVAGLCFYLGTRFLFDWHAGADWPAETAVFMLGAVLMIAFFPTYRLYSYHLIFNTASHARNLLKAFCWSGCMFVIVAFLYTWPALFSRYALMAGMAVFLMALAVVVLANLLRPYMANLVKAMGISFIVVGLAGIIRGDEMPLAVRYPGAALAAILLTMFGIALARYFLVRVVYNVWLRRYFRRQVAVIGSGDEAAAIIQHIVRRNAPFWVAGLVTSNRAAPAPAASAVMCKECLGDLCALPDIIADRKLDEVIITDMHIDPQTLIALLDYCIARGVIAWFPPKLLPIIEMKLYIDNFCGLPMIRLCAQRNAQLFTWIKHALDALVCLPLMLLLAPVFSIIALAIKLDSRGPVFYKATTVGKSGRIFKMYKFRSMYIDQAADIHKTFVTQLIKGEIRRADGEKSVLKITDDPRVTRVGRLLRKFSLDELPQLINVLKGEMSLVGPRPCLPYEYELYKDWHKRRNSVRPGITGLWQVTGRSEVSFEEMIMLDLYYIYNRTLMLDLNILFETVFVVLGARGAY